MMFERAEQFKNCIVNGQGLNWLENLPISGLASSEKRREDK